VVFKCDREGEFFQPKSKENYIYKLILILDNSLKKGAKFITKKNIKKHKKNLGCWLMVYNILY
jgi:hypothetical protein